MFVLLLFSIKEMLSVNLYSFVWRYWLCGESGRELWFCDNLRGHVAKSLSTAQCPTGSLQLETGENSGVSLCQHNHSLSDVGGWIHSAFWWCNTGFYSFIDQSKFEKIGSNSNSFVTLYEKNLIMDSGWVGLNITIQWAAIRKVRLSDWSGLVWWSAKQPCSSLVTDSGEPWGSAHLPAKWLLLQAVTALWIDWHKCQPLIRHGASSTFRTTPDACVWPVGSRAGRDQQRGNGRNRKGACLRHLDGGCIDMRIESKLCQRRLHHNQPSKTGYQTWECTLAFY